MNRRTPKPVSGSVGIASQDVRPTQMSQKHVEGTFAVHCNVDENPLSHDETLRCQSSGLWVFRDGSDGLKERLEPVKDCLDFTQKKQVVLALNDIFARAYFGCKVWEAELTAKPQDGTGFLKYITPEGRVVFFPLSWCFSECPQAFFLAAPSSEQELQTEFSHVNVYTSLAEMANTGAVKAYFRIYSDMDPRRDVAQSAQLVVYSDARVTVKPETVSSDTEVIEVNASSLTSQPSDSVDNGLANLVPAKVGFFSLESGQVICRDEARWELKAARRRHDRDAESGCIEELFGRVSGVLPPEFTPVEEFEALSSYRLSPRDIDSFEDTHNSFEDTHTHTDLDSLESLEPAETSPNLLGPREFTVLKP